MSEKVIRTLNIKVEGDLGVVPQVSLLIQSCVKMNSEQGRETGDFYFQNLHVTYSYAEHKVVHKGPRKKKEVEDEANEQDNTTEEEYEDMRRNGGPGVKP